MSPLDRISQRAAAFTILGVPAAATREDIRKAYRKLAFDKHPDRNPESSSEFARISSAYQFVTENADELGIKSAPKAKAQPEQYEASIKPRKVSRPQVRSAETRFDGATLRECEELLDAEGGPGTLHTAVSVYRTGRALTYFVPNALQPGRNEVAVPTGMLVDSRHVMPKIIAFDSREAAGGLYEMDEDHCHAHFPGARSIQVRFAQA